MADVKSKFPKYPSVSVVTPKGIARFPHVHKTDQYKDGAPKFKATIVFDGDTNLGAITEAALKVAAAAFPTRTANKVNVLIKAGDEAEKNGEPIPELASKNYITASCNETHPPKIVGPDRMPLPAGMEVRGGDEIKLILAPIPSDTPIKGTITFRLLAVQLVSKNSGGGGDYASMFDEEGEGFGSGPADPVPSRGVEAGAADVASIDDDEIPF